MIESKHASKEEMNTTRNLLAHGVYLGLYAFFKYLPFPFFEYFRYAIIRLFSRTIETSYIKDGVTIMFPWRVRIGRNSSLNQGVIIDGFGGVSIGCNVRIASYCTLNTADHCFEDPDTPIHEQGYLCAPITIEDDVWLGSHVNVNKGVTIGRGSVIGAGSVVTRDIPPYSIAVGIPCKPIRSRKPR